MRAREFSPAWGRFLSTDPIGQAGGENLYAFGQGRPDLRDPTGLDSAAGGDGRALLAKQFTLQSALDCSGGNGCRWNRELATKAAGVAAAATGTLDRSLFEHRRRQRGPVRPHDRAVRLRRALRVRGQELAGGRDISQRAGGALDSLLTTYAITAATVFGGEFVPAVRFLLTVHSTASGAVDLIDGIRRRDPLLAASGAFDVLQGPLALRASAATGTGTSGGSRAGKLFTRKGKREIHATNAERHGGANICETCGVEVVPGQRLQSGVVLPGNERQRDHDPEEQERRR